MIREKIKVKPVIAWKIDLIKTCLNKGYVTFEHSHGKQLQIIQSQDPFDARLEND